LNCANEVRQDAVRRGGVQAFGKTIAKIQKQRHRTRQETNILRVRGRTVAVVQDGSFQVAGLQLVERLRPSGVNLQKQVQPANPSTRRRAREKRKKTITAVIVTPASVQAEDVAELPRLVRGAGLRFEGLLDRVLISHIL
jgi:hypothetical protein